MTSRLPLQSRMSVTVPGVVSAAVCSHDSATGRAFLLFRGKKDAFVTQSCSGSSC